MQQVFDAVRIAKPDKLYYAVDGARPGKNEDEKVQQVRDIVKQVDWPCYVHTFHYVSLGVWDNLEPVVGI